jgi:multiple sugar transport system substrate-binding protein/putative aldouronate transport system substrate-binding protein
MILTTGLVFAGGRQQAPASGGKPTLSPAGLTGDALAHSKFTKPVDVHIGLALDPIDTTLPAGDSPQNNAYTRELRARHNINYIIDWTAAQGEDYNQKVSLCLASDTLPDALHVTTQMYLLKAAKAGMLYDITDLYNEYASELVKERVNLTNGRAMDMVSWDGRMVALPNITVTTDGVYVLNVQKNWLDQYGLAVPKTVDDVERVARVFKERRPAGANTIPIIGPDKNSNLYSTFIESSNLTNGFDPVFAASDVYPGFFLNNGNGTVSYGSLDSKVRPVLQRLASWYKEGLIDPEMGTRDNSGEPVNANNVGMRFGPWWALGYGNGDSFRNDPNVNWQAYPIYSDTGKWNSHMKSVGLESIIINRRASPDTVAAVIISYNTFLRDPETFETDLNSCYLPLRTPIARADETEVEYEALTKILRGEAQVRDYEAMGKQFPLVYSSAQALRGIVPTYRGDREINASDFKMDTAGVFFRLYAILVGDRPFATQKIDKEVYSVTYSMTDMLEQRWPNLWKMENEVMMKIVTGQSDISAYDKFVSDWRTQGGQGVLDDLADLFYKK